eukprot:5025930-Amphidinium_carterae.1
MVAQLKGIPLEYGEFGDMPFYRKVPVTHRVRRFQLGKLAITLKEIQEEEEAALKREEASVDEPPASLSTMSTLPVPLDDSFEQAQLQTLASNQAADGSAASASDAIASAVQRRAQQRINQRPPSSALSSMPTVSEEEIVPPSDPGSYRSMEDADAVEDQNEPPPDE